MKHYPLFVYGTLRSQGVYHHMIKDYIKYIQPAWTYGTLFHYAFKNDLGYYPYITEGINKIQGELVCLFKVKEIFSIIDDFEDNGIIYERILKSVFTENKIGHLSWIYFIKKGSEKKGRYIPSGDWIKEVNRGNTLTPLDI